VNVNLKLIHFIWRKNMKRVSFITLFITICVILNAQTGEEMLKRAISTNPTNSWNSGNKQKGQWTNGNNISAFLFSDGTMYFGNFLNNDYHGYGILIVPQGKQIINCPNARYYVGNFSNDDMNGKGACYDESGTLIYYGEFKNNKPTGTYPTTGSYTSYKFQTIDYTGGDKYIGETKDGKRHGYGVLAWKDGEIWIGNWKDDVRAGQGIYIDSDGSFITGYWEHNTRRDTATAVASDSPRSSSNQSSGINPYTGGYVTSICSICSGKGQIQALNPMYGMGAADAIRYGYRNTTPMYIMQACYGCKGLGTISTYVPPVTPTPSSPSSNNYGSSSPSSSGRTRTCDLCLGKGQLWEYTGSVGDNRTTVYCSVSGCNVKSPHRHTTCNRCSGTGKLNL
jgi:hypothetical protein